MIRKLTYNNPITNKEDCIEICYPTIDYAKFKRLHDYNNDSDLIEILNNILKDLDCSREYNGVRFRTTSHLIYNTFLSDYYFYLNKITNQFIYNEYVDKLIKRHVDNLVFEHEHPYVENNNKKKNTNKRKKSPPNKFIKYTTKDIFTNKTKYVYCNYKTDEQIVSDNEDMLDKLNSVKKKSTKSKQIGVPMSAMTFSFKKKNK